MNRQELTHIRKLLCMCT